MALSFHATVEVPLMSHHDSIMHSLGSPGRQVQRYVQVLCDIATHLNLWARLRNY